VIQCSNGATRRCLQFPIANRICSHDPFWRKECCSDAYHSQGKGVGPSHIRLSSAEAKRVERLREKNHLCWRFGFLVLLGRGPSLLVLARPDERLAEVAASRNGKDGSVYTIERSIEEVIAIRTRGKPPQHRGVVACTLECFSCLIDSNV
jgi:hypothetical protein